MLIGDVWTRVDGVGGKALQISTDGSVEIVMQASQPAVSVRGLVVRDEWRQYFGAQFGVIWMRQGPNTSRAELTILDWIEVDLTGPSLGGNAITPSDGADLPVPVRAVTIGAAAGVVKYTHARTGAICTTGPLPIGQHSIWASRIWATGTTATGLTGWV